MKREGKNVVTYMTGEPTAGYDVSGGKCSQADKVGHRNGTSSTNARTTISFLLDPRLPLAPLLPPRNSALSPRSAPSLLASVVIAVTAPCCHSPVLITEI